MASTVQSTVNAPKPAAVAPGASDDQSAMKVWFEKNQKLVGYGAIAVAVIVVGGWLFIETGKRKELAGLEALDRARSAFEAGNLPVASTEFQRVAQSFGGTEAGYSAELAVNEVRLASGQTQIAADELKKFAEKNPPAFYASGAWSMRGGALENLKKYDDAAQAYGKSAELAAEDYRKVDALLGQARSLRLAGKEKDAEAVLRGIIGKFGREVPGEAEAEVRLAEWTKGAL
jgi:predicted negative regulator of RcsB-dependent stress response